MLTHSYSGIWHTEAVACNHAIRPRSPSHPLGRLEQQEHSGLHSQVASILLDLELEVVLCNSITSIFIIGINELFLIHQQIPCKSVYHRLVVGFVRESLPAPVRSRNGCNTGERQMKASKRLCMLLMRMRLYHAHIDVLMQSESPVRVSE